MRRRYKSIISFILIMLITIGLLPIPPERTSYAAVIDDTGDLNLQNNDPVTISPIYDSKKGYPNPIPNTGKVVYSGKWNVYVNKKLAGYDKAVKNLVSSTKKADQYNFVQFSKIGQWISVFDGDPTFVNANAGKFKVTISGSQRIYLSYLANLCGGYVGRWEVTGEEGQTGNVYADPRDRPTANISVPRSAKEGESVKITLSGQAFSVLDDVVSNALGIPTKQVIASFNIDGQPVFSGKKFDNTNSYSETITQKFSAGSHTLTLFIKDNVNRYTRKDVTINVEGTPPPPGTINAALKMTLDPASVIKGKTSDIKVSLDASGSRSSGSGPFDYRWWVKVNGKYINPGGSEGINPGDHKATYSLTAEDARAGDVIWAKVQVYDWSINKSAQAETEGIVYEEGEEPVPEPIPEDPPEPPPVPEPPIARFTMPAEMGVGKKVKIINNSYDPDGPEIYGLTMDCLWDISPHEELDDSGLKPAGGYVTFNKPGDYTVALTVTDLDGLSDTVSHDIKITNQPPVARIQAPDEVTQGDEVNIYSDSYDPDGNLDTVSWILSPNEDVIGTLSGDENKLVFNRPGSYEITLTAKDTCGLADTAKKTIVVKPAVPEAYFTYSGTTKVNRKIVLDSSGSMSSPTFPVDFSKNEWEFVPSEGSTAADIKIVASTDLKTRQILFKKPGDYKIRLRVTNTAGNASEWYEQILKIYPDDPPVADFYVQASVLRDPDNGNKATIELIDSSYSPDGDIISQRIWKYKYDSNNNGSFADESWTTLDNGNNTNPVLIVTQVGRYLFELSVKESFGEETIPEFITATDYQQADTSAKPEENKISEVANLQPTVDFDAIVKPQIDLSVIGVTNTSGLANAITSQANTLATGLSADGFSVKNTAKVYTQDTQLQRVQRAEIYFNAWHRPFDPDEMVFTNYNYQTGIGDFGRVLTHSAVPGSDNYNELYVYAELLDYGIDEDDYTPTKYPRVSYSADGNTWNNLTMTYTGSYSDWRYNVDDLPFDERPFYGRAFRFKSNAVQGNIRYVRVLDNNGRTSDQYIVNVDATAYGNKEVIVPTSLNDDKFTSAISQQSWRDTAEKYVVMITDSNSEIKDAQKIIDQYVSKGIKAIVVGTSTIRTAGQKIADGTGGAFFEFSGTNIPWSQIQEYLSNILRQQKVITQTLLLGQEIDVKTYYSDPEGDPKYQERWLYDHDPAYFENSMGLADFSGQYLSGPVTSFDRVGKYDVIFQARDNPKNDSRFDNYRLWSYMPLNKLELYVHRKPVAQFTIANMTPNEVQPLNITENFEDDNLNFAFTGDWARTDDEDYGGQYSYYSSNTPRNSANVAQFSFTVPDGAKNAKISFNYMVRSEANCDFFNFYINGSRLLHKSGAGSWEPYSCYLSPGTYTFVFEYAKDPTDSRYEDAAFIDNIAVRWDGSTTDYNISLNSVSYDLDHQSEAAKGIVQEEWIWKEATASSWHTGKPTTLALNKNYLVWLRVKDKEGAWSDPYVKVISTMNDNLAPIAQFSVNPSTQVTNKSLIISDQSYDPNGDPIAEWKWRVQKPNGSWVDYGGTKPTNIPSLGVGTYTIELTVRDNPQYGTTLWSEPYTQTVTIIPENNKPVARFSISPNPIIADELYTINDTSYDPDSDPIVAREWKVQKPDGSWVTVNDWKSTFEEMGFDDDGTYKIQLRVLDDPTKRHPALTPLWSDPYTVTVQVEGKLTVIGDSDKDTYAAGQALLLDAETEGKAFKVEAQCWWNHNEYTSTNTTTLVPDRTITDPPQDVMTWHSRRERGNRDIIVIIPMKTADGTYPVKFTAYKRKADGTVKTAEDIIYVNVRGTIYDYSHSEIIGK